MRRPISLVLVQLVVQVILFILSETVYKKVSPHTYKYPKLFLWIGLLDQCLCIAIAVLMFILDQVKIIILICISIMYFLGIVLFCYGFNIKIELTDECIVYYNILRQKRIYKYTDVSSISTYYSRVFAPPQMYVIRFNNKRLKIEYTIMNFTDFFADFKKHLKRHNHKCVYEKFINSKKVQLTRNKRIVVKATMLESVCSIFLFSITLVLTPFVLISDTFNMFVVLCSVVTFIISIKFLFDNCLCQIVIYTDKEYFEYKVLFLKKYSIPYRKCVSYTNNNNKFILNNKVKNIKIDTRFDNLYYLLEILESYGIPKK